MENADKTFNISYFVVCVCNLENVQLWFSCEGNLFLFYYFPYIFCHQTYHFQYINFYFEMWFSLPPSLYLSLFIFRLENNTQTNKDIADLWNFVSISLLWSMFQRIFCYLLFHGMNTMRQHFIWIKRAFFSFPNFIRECLLLFLAHPCVLIHVVPRWYSWKTKYHKAY